MEENNITVPTPLGGYPEAEQVLMSLGCSIQKYLDHQIVTFPPGTQRKELPRIHYPRYQITLPDGLILSQYSLMFNSDLFTLTLPDSLLPDPATLPTFKETREKHGVTLEDLIKQSRLSGAVVQMIDSRGKGKREEIDRLLNALSDSTGEQYSRWNIGGFTFI